MWAQAPWRPWLHPTQANADELPMTQVVAESSASRLATGHSRTNEPGLRPGSDGERPFDQWALDNNVNIRIDKEKGDLL
jgi:hypothetical protein